MVDHQRSVGLLKKEDDEIEAKVEGREEEVGLHEIRGIWMLVRNGLRQGSRSHS